MGRKSKKKSKIAEINVFVCHKHFTDKFLNTNNKRVTLLKKYNPIPLLQTNENFKPHCASAVNGCIAQLIKRQHSRPSQVDINIMLKKDDTLTSVSGVTDPRVEITHV